MGGTEEIELDRTASAAAIAEALRGSAFFQLECPGAPRTWTGKIVGLSRDTMILERTSADASLRNEPDDLLNIEFLLRGDSYHFAATATFSRGHCGEERIALRRTSPVTVRQRRRFWRSSVRPTCRAALRTTGGRRIAEGVLLNVSRDGMACRVSAERGNRLDTDMRLHAEFTLDGDDRPFEVVAALRAVTPASDPADVILRLQFEWERDDENIARIERLTGMTAAATS